MNRIFQRLFLGLLALSLTTLHADGFLGGLKKDDKKLNSEQLTTQEGSANAMLEKARGYESSGKRRQARDTYKAIVKSYPRTDAAAEAQFSYAKILEAEGDDKKAFEQYQELLVRHRNTPKFNEAVGNQFQIADGLRNSTKKGFLGLGAPVQPSKLIEMFEQIAETAPYTQFAPKALLNIGYVHSKQGETDQAIAAFKTVVDTYQSSEYATEAQYQIFKLRGVTAEQSNSPNKDRAQVEAGIDFVSQNPDDQRAMEVQSNLQSIEERSMEKLFTTGEFYEKSNKPDSARIYYREVVKNPNTPWAAKAQARLNVLDRVPQASPPTVEKKAGFFGANPLKKDKVEMRTSEDDVVPLPAGDATE
jgi:outer membrane protein assembly factor BamD